MASEYSEWMEIAKTLGMQGSELKAFIKEKEAEKREERLQERNEKIRLTELANEAKKIEAAERRLEREAEEKRLVIEKEEKRLEREAKAEEKRLERESDEKKRQEENELKKLELQLLNNIKLKELEIRQTQENRISTDNGIFRGSNESITNDNTRFIKIPMFKPEVDNLDSFLLRFERICEAYKVKPDLWALTLARSLEGRALEVYQRMNTEDAHDYKKIERGTSQEI